MKEAIFALDIGTQSVTGILLKENEKNQYEIIDIAVKHHEERSMLDGQIHDVLAVANVIEEVKQSLETSHAPLQRVAVAAAGRALKTIRTEISVPMKEQQFSSKEDLTFFELSAVQKAQKTLAANEKHAFSTYHCVGYSVLHYYLDGEKIGSLIDQEGQEAKVEVIATFLPNVVIQSLLAALERAQLSMEALTLEPIAAIHVLVPSSMRRLNIALIDIGAGTSDIAIAKEETIIAYGMVPSAGDEITEAISDAYLLDFKVAEQVKKNILQEKEIVVEDILGFEKKLTYEDFLTRVENSVDKLAKLLANQVIELNSKTPQAIMLIGGGSLTPLINKKIAGYLHLPENRVAIRDTAAIQGVDMQGKVPTDPAFVTPIGIAVKASQAPLKYMQVTVNDKLTTMFDTKYVSIGQCLIQAGINVHSYFGSFGLSAMITYNDKTMTLRGVPGQAPIILRNGQVANIDDIVEAEDVITIEKGNDGVHAAYTIAEIVDKKQTMELTINGQAYTLETTYEVNGLPVDDTTILNDKDALVVRFPKNIAEFLKMHPSLQAIKSKIIYVNGRKVELSEPYSVMMVNGQEASLSHPLSDGDDIMLRSESNSMTVQNLLEQLEGQYLYNIRVTFNGTPVLLQTQTVNVLRGDSILQITDSIHEADELIIKKASKKPFIFQDVFRYVDIPIENGSYTLYKNDVSTSFHENIQDGDALEIRWNEK